MSLAKHLALESSRHPWRDRCGVALVLLSLEADAAALGEALADRVGFTDTSTTCARSPSGGRGRDRWWLQAPTLDNGSARFAQGRAGADSDPRMLTFTVGDDGGSDDLWLLAA